MKFQIISLAAVKPISAILLSVLLIWAPVGFTAATAASPQTPARKHCACAGLSCCVTPSAPASQPLPAAPVRGAAPDASLQLLWASAVHVLGLPELTVPALSFSDFSSFKHAAAVPLYYRHCSVLI